MKKKRELKETIAILKADPFPSETRIRPRGLRRRVQSHPRGQSMTKQADTEKADMNRILSRASSTGLLPQRVAQPLSGEIPDIESFHDAMNLIVNANNQFMALPVAIREEFRHSPEAFLDFARNPENAEKMVTMGLAQKKAPDAPQPVFVVNSPATTQTPPVSGENKTLGGE